jgi:transposase
MSKRSLRVFSCEFKHRMVLRLANGERVAALAEEASRQRQRIGGDFLNLCRRESSDGGDSCPRRRLRSSSEAASSADAAASSAASSAEPAAELAKAQARIAELERLVGRQQVDLHFFREALRLWDATSHDSGAPTFTRSSKK